MATSEEMPVGHCTVISVLAWSWYVISIVRRILGAQSDSSLLVLRNQYGHLGWVSFLANVRNLQEHVQFSMSESAKREYR